MGARTPVAAVVLAAGQGKRMKSGLAKVLHEAGGRPLLGHVLEAVEGLDPQERVVVVGRDAEQVRAAFAGRAAFVLQAEQRGTGHAVQQAAPLLRSFDGDVLVLYGDVPLLRAATLRRMLEHKARTGAALVMLSARLPLPGRVVRDAEGRVSRIVEVTDASPEELAIEEGNTGVYLVSAGFLWKALDQLDDANEQGELYVTDIVGRAVAEGLCVEALVLEDAVEALGVNTRAELAQAAAVVRRRTAERLMAQGVTLVDPDSVYIDADVEIGRDTRIDPGVVITGATRIGEGVHVKPHCVIEDSTLGDDVVLGPSAHLRPGTRLGEGARIGNFVEVKNSDLGPGVKADHLSYIGDADVGAGASFGCGSITVNYDGIAKHRTQVGERAFVGCNANLIAPRSIGADSYVAAGSTVTGDVPEDALAVARARQRLVEGWVSRRRRRADGSAEEPDAGKGGAGAKAAGARAGAKKRAGRAKQTGGEKAERPKRARKGARKKG